LAESDHEVSFHELPVKFHQLLIGSFVPVFGWAPQPMELILSARGEDILIEINVLVNGTPCAVQSASNPAVDKGWIRSSLKIYKVNPTYA